MAIMIVIREWQKVHECPFVCTSSFGQWPSVIIIMTTMIGNENLNKEEERGSPAKCEDSFQTLLISSPCRGRRRDSCVFIEGDTTMIFCAALTITFELPDSDYSMIHSIIHNIDLDPL